MAITTVRTNVHAHVLQKRGRALVGALLVGLALTVLIRGFTSDAGRSGVLIIGVDIWVGFAPLYLARDLGYFSDEGIDVDLVTMKGTAEMRAALQGHQIHGVTTSIDTALRSRALGVPGRVALALDRSAGADGLVLRAPLRAIGDLRGQNIAVQPSTPSEFFLLYVLEKAGVPLGAVTRVDMDSADAGAAFVARRVDAAVTWEPWLGRAASEPGAHVAASTADLDDVILDVLVIRDDVCSQRPDDVAGIRRAWYRAVLYMNEHPDDAARRLAPVYGVAADEFSAMISGLIYLNEAENERLLAHEGGTGDLSRVIEAANRIYMGTGELKGPVSWAELVDERAGGG